MSVETVGAVSAPKSVPERRDSGSARRSFAFGSFGALCLTLVALGWVAREERYLSAETGMGYGLGIAGTAAMLLLLFYSLRKRARFMRDLAPIRYWFHTHMVLGILGPVAILFHSGFRIGSLNSSVALLCVIVVSASGVLGRFIYPKIHYGLSEKRATLRELRSAANSRRVALDEAMRASPELRTAIGEFESYAASGERGFLRAAWRTALLAPRARATRRECLRAFERRGADSTNGRFRESRLRLATEVKEYLTAVRRVSELTTYEKLFSLWHAFHLPLCFILFGAAAVHVVAVHMY